MTTISLIPVTGMPEIQPGDILAEIIVKVADFRDGDVLVVTQKIVSKAEGRLVRADATSGDADTARVLRRRGELLITETTHGFVCEHAGVDVANVEPGWAASPAPSDILSPPVRSCGISCTRDRSPDNPAEKAECGPTDTVGG